MKEETREARHQQGLCYDCGLNPPVNPAKSRSRCRACLNKRQREYRAGSNYVENTKRHYIKMRTLAFEHYGHVCVCCGESNEAFLEFDHKNGDGADHRKIYGHDLAGWLVRHNFPSDYEIQVLCRNCNWAKFKYGVCPHQA